MSIPRGLMGTAILGRQQDIYPVSNHGEHSRLRHIAGLAQEVMGVTLFTSY
jgi:hypothetical protein